MGQNNIADRVSAVVWVVLGVGMIWGGWVMDRLEVFKIQQVSIPGLVPMLVGAVLALCGIALWFEKAGQDESLLTEIIPEEVTEIPEPPHSGLRRLWLTIALCLVYALILVGWLDFTLATFLFIATFKLTFTDREQLRHRPLRELIAALGFAALAAFGISLLFEDGFLVRLP